MLQNENLIFDLFTRKIRKKTMAPMEKILKFFIVS